MDRFSDGLKCVLLGVLFRSRPPLAYFRILFSSLVNQESVIFTPHLGLLLLLLVGLRTSQRMNENVFKVRKLEGEDGRRRRSWLRNWRSRPLASNNSSACWAAPLESHFNWRRWPPHSAQRTLT